jgi:hypothetical protein
VSLTVTTMLGSRAAKAQLFSVDRYKDLADAVLQAG